MQAPSVPPDQELSFRIVLRTRWSDEDNQAVLNNAVYLTLLEEARYAYFSRLGLLETNRFPFVLLQTNIRFVSPGKGGAEVEVAMVTTSLGQSSFGQAYRVTSRDTGTIWCEAEAVLVSYDPDKNCSRPMDPAFRSALSDFEPCI